MPAVAADHPAAAVGLAGARKPARPQTPWLLVLLGWAGCAGCFYFALQIGSGSPIMAFLPLGAVLAVAAGILVLHACMGSARATMAVLFALFFVNDALFRVRDPGDLGLDWQSALKFLIWAAACAIGVCNLRRSWHLLLQGRVLLILTWLGIAFLSCFYSASPSYSFATAFGTLSMLLLAAGMTVILTEKQMLLTTIVALTVFVLAGWVAYYAVPELGRSLFIKPDGSVVERMCGLAGQANALGCCLATMLAATFLLWTRGHVPLRTAGPFAALALFTLLTADSRTALLAFIFGAVAVFVRYSLWRFGASLLLVSIATTILTAVPLKALMSVGGSFSRSGDPGEMLTLTGRTEIWAFVWDKVQLQPWFGYGYNSSKFILPLFLGLPGLTVDEAHNTWLQNLLGTGIVGTTPIAVLMVVQLISYVRSPNSFRDIMLFITLIWGITVAGCYGSTPTVMTLFVFMSHMAPARVPVSSSLARYR